MTILYDLIEVSHGNGPFPYSSVTGDWMETDSENRADAGHNSVGIRNGI